MPKERTHWLLALRTRKSLPSGDLKDLLERQEDAYLLGAVAPDTPFLPVFLNERQEAQRNYFHGENNPAAFSYWARAFRQGWNEREEIVAFLYGLTSHIVSDAVFHPAVYYFCGWDDHPNPKVVKHAASRHYRLETLLDMYFYNYFSMTAERGRLTRLLHSIDLDSIAEAAAFLFFPDDPPVQKVMKQLFLSHAFYQERYDRWDYRIITRLLKTVGISRHGQVNLFYHSAPGRFAEIPFSYRHPVTGEKISTSWIELFDNALREGSEILAMIAGKITEGTIHDLPAGPHPTKGLSSDHAAVLELSFCDPQTPERLFLL